MATTNVLPFKPPRPPNSWILFRSYIMRKFQPKDPTERKDRQAVTSSLASAYWKTITPETKRHFENEAERLKRQHQAMYPGYKYQPVKKEVKARAKELQKEQRRAQKRDKRSQRGVSASNSTVPPAPIQPHVAPYCNPHVEVFPAALSPPLSAASSPAGTDAVNSPPFDLSFVVASPPTPICALPELTPAEVQVPPMQMQMQMPPMLPAELQMPMPMPLPALFQESVLPPPLPIPFDPAMYLGQTPFATESGLQFWQPQANHGSSLDSSEVEKDMNVETGMEPFLKAPTPGMFHMQAQAGHDGLDVNAFLNVSHSDKDVMLPPSLMDGSLFADCNNQDDFSSWMNPLFADDMGLSQVDSYSLDSQSSLYSGYPFEPSFSSPFISSEIISHASPPQLQLEPDVGIPLQGYLPPSGAMYSSTRRVAGKWSIPPFSA